MPRYYCGIGSRQTPPLVLDLMGQAAGAMEAQGFTLRSGGAPGADDAFEQGCSKKEIYLPWSPFNNRAADGVTHFLIPEGIKEEAYRIAEHFHPGWRYLKRGARALMARNVLQVLGLDLQTPSELILCWTPGGKIEGGTGQALRMAQHYRIEVVNYGLYYGQ